MISLLPYWSDKRAAIYQGDVLQVLDAMPKESVHLAITSPPYLGLRSYSASPTIWGGDPLCEHTEWRYIGSASDLSANKRGGSLDTASDKQKSNAGTVPFMTKSIRHSGLVHLSETRPGSTGPASGEIVYLRDRHADSADNSTNMECTSCNAVRGHLGQEPIPDCLGWTRGVVCNRCYVCRIVTISRSVQRVLRSDGCFFLNIGDVSAGSNKGAIADGSQVGGRKQLTNTGSVSGLSKAHDIEGLKAGDLMLIPERLSLALQADGWYVRQNIIFEHGHPMPESVNGIRWERHRIKISGAITEGPRYRRGDPSELGYASDLTPSSDVVKWNECVGCSKCQDNGGYVLKYGRWRPTKSYEFIFMLAKSNRYFADLESAKEPLSSTHKSGNKKRKLGVAANNDRLNTHLGSSVPWDPEESSGRNVRSVWTFNSEPFGLRICKVCDRSYDSKDLKPLARDSKTSDKICVCAASDWIRHFALFPTALPDKIIRAMTSEHGVCDKCGAPYARMIRRGIVSEHPDQQR